MVAIPLHAHKERLYVGIDIAKSKHVAGFLSAPLLASRQKFNNCPSFSFQNTREGFEFLVSRMADQAPLAMCLVIVENTGHYGRALIQYLRAHHIEIYSIHAAKRLSKNKTDRSDALNLANILYNQEELKVQASDAQLEAHRYEEATATAAQLAVLAQRRQELTQGITKIRNKLTAICDELFPEFVTVIKDPNLPTALAIRHQYPTAAHVAAASVDDLLALRSARTKKPGRPTLQRLVDVAKFSVGNVDEFRIRGLIIEQRQLIEELRLANQHADELDRDIAAILAESREGAILMSIDGIGPTHAASIIAAIGNINNFESASKLRGYFGWSPRWTQTGTTIDSATLDKGGNNMLKSTMYLVAMVAIKNDTEWKAIYDRLVPIKCRYDDRKKTYSGKIKVLGRIAGQIVGVIYSLLKRDSDYLARLEPGQSASASAPVLYSREVHRFKMGRVSKLD
ncbi:IS110 family transposase [Tengunoibacter tsumagoiensis]|uniref:IS110 family transposase n=1 Tax=Tengunoibacter tsumagoiensis TaxID=2014871 RepID=A0A402A4T6_9CHLR|nr:IS110 family transposase [Tengunoibacter tsumagoiensis]GCE14164.1 IS110 family transposase [Tengunoibacter tsumagoiensis]GCE14218.1 IS110 family transposase [Tengunoibacter tsumagoiensis]